MCSIKKINLNVIERWTDWILKNKVLCSSFSCNKMFAHFTHSLVGVIMERYIKKAHEKTLLLLSGCKHGPPIALKDGSLTA